MKALSKKSTAQKFFDKLVSKMEGIKIKNVFAFDIGWSNHRGYRTYRIGIPFYIYILFENEECLVIQYPNINSLEAEVRPLTKEEIQRHEESPMKEFFNSTAYVYSEDISHKDTCFLEFDTMKSVEIRSVTEECSQYCREIYSYEWVEPTEETFDEVKIIMNNGKSITFCGDTAEHMGDAFLWSEDSRCENIDYPNNGQGLLYDFLQEYYMKLYEGMDEEKFNPALLVDIEKRSPEILQILGNMFTYTDINGGETPALMCAIQEADPYMTEYLILRGADPDGYRSETGSNWYVEDLEIQRWNRENANDFLGAIEMTAKVLEKYCVKKLW